MVNRDQLAGYLNQILAISQYRDYCPNGLQIQGKDQIKRIISGVSISQALVAAAIAQKADAILVHHGCFWDKDTMVLQGFRYQRVQALISQQINLYAYHIPLDVHIEYGNNYQLAQRMGWVVEGDVLPAAQSGLLLYGTLQHAQSPSAFSQALATCLDRTPVHIAAKKKSIHRIAWCTGAGQDFLEQAAEHDIDAYVTGEISERHVHMAKELNVHFFAAGHHATERFGVQALGAHLADQFGIAHQYIEIDNPI